MKPVPRQKGLRVPSRKQQRREPVFSGQALLLDQVGSEPIMVHPLVVIAQLDQADPLVLPVHEFVKQGTHRPIFVVGNKVQMRLQ